MPRRRDAFEQHVDGRLQVDDQVGHRRVDREPLVDLLVQRELLVVEREPREQPVFLEHVVGDAHLLEQVGLAQVLQLPRPLEQEIQLRLERDRVRVAVEALEKRVLGILLEHQLAAEAAAEAAHEAGLADADRAFDHDVAVRRRHDGLVAGVLVAVVGGHARAFQECVRRADGARRRSSASTLPTPGTSRDGLISASGTSTKSRSAIPGCGKVSVSLAATRVAVHEQVEVDQSRTPAHDRGFASEHGFERLAIPATAQPRSSCVSSAAAALTKSGCSTGPNGRER